MTEPRTQAHEHEWEFHRSEFYPQLDGWWCKVEGCNVHRDDKPKAHADTDAALVALRDEVAFFRGAAILGEWPTVEELDHALALINDTAQAAQQAHDRIAEKARKDERELWREALRHTEWVMLHEHTSEDGEYTTVHLACPSCGMSRMHGHLPECRLRALLADQSEGGGE